MAELLRMVEQNFAFLFVSGLAWVLLWFAGSALYRKWKGKPLLAKRPPDAQFLEAWTSGRSNRSLLTKVGGARNCLLVAVTRTSLIVRPHFPFSLMFLPEIYDLEYVIAKRDIRSVSPKSGLFGQTIEVAFAASSGDMRSIELRLRQPQAFLRAVAAQ